MQIDVVTYLKALSYSKEDVVEKNKIIQLLRKKSIFFREPQIIRASHEMLGLLQSKIYIDDNRYTMLDKIRGYEPDKFIYIVKNSNDINKEEVVVLCSNRIDAMHHAKDSGILDSLIVPDETIRRWRTEYGYVDETVVKRLGWSSPLKWCYVDSIGITEYRWYKLPQITKDIFMFLTTQTKAEYDAYVLDNEGD